MTTPFWCILITALLPYLWSTVSLRARVAQFGSFDNRLPRLEQAKLTGSGARALGASANAFETFPFFAASVIVAGIAGADPGWSSIWSVSYLAARILHGVFYYRDVDKLRSVAFGLGQVCCVALFVLAALAS